MCVKWESRKEEFTIDCLEDQERKDEKEIIRRLADRKYLRIK